VVAAAGTRRFLTPRHQAAADAALKAAIDCLALGDMRAALEAGAKPPTSFAWASACVDDAPTDERTAAALRLLAEYAMPLLLPHAASAVLLEAARCGAGPRVVEFFVAAGADVTGARSGSGNTALHMVMRADIASLLLAAGARVDVRNTRGETPLVHLCGHAPKPEIVRVLIEAGADVNASDARGRTPLDATIGVVFEQYSCMTIHVLLAAGADPAMCSCRGQTLLQTALSALGALALRCGNHGWMAAKTIECARMVRAVTRAAAWHRRRQMLLAVRGRYGGAAAAAGARAQFGGVPPL